MAITKEQMLEIAHKLNPVISASPLDTMFKTATVLGYISDLKPIDGMVNDNFYYGQEMVLEMCKNALMFHVHSDDIE